MTMRYVAGGTLPPGSPTYVERQADAVLFDRLLAGEYSHVLTPRQMGKSSLMVRTTAKLRAAGVACAIIDLSASGHHVDAQQWYESLIWVLAERLAIEESAAVLLESSVNVNPVLIWQRAVRKLVLERIAGPIVIFIDEIDITRRIPFSDEFFASIRALYNARAEYPELNRLTFCLIGTATPTDLISDPLLTPFNIGARIELRDFTMEEASLFRHGLGASDEVNRRLFERVFFWTHGHPYLTQRLCKEIADRGNVRTIADVDACCRDLFLMPQSIVREDNLAYVAQRLTPSDEETRTEVLTRYRQALAGKRVPDDETDATVPKLKLSGVVSVQDGALVVRNRIYARVFDTAWIDRNMPDAELRRQRRAYRLGLRRAAAAAAVVLLALTALTALAVNRAAVARSATRLANRRARDEARARNRADAAATQAQSERVRADAEATRVASERDRADSAARQERRMALLASDRERQARRNAALAELQRTRAERQTRIARTETTTAQRSLYVANISEAWQDYEHMDLASARARLASEIPRPGWPDLRGFEWAYLNALCHQEVGRLAAHSKAVRSLAFSPDGKLLASAGDDGSVRIWSRPSLAPVAQLSLHSFAALSVAFSPDGKLLAYSGSDRNIHLWRCADRRVIATLSGHTEDVNCVRFYPDGALLASASDDGTVRLWDANSRLCLATFGPRPAWATCLAFSRDGKRLEAGYFDGTETDWDVASRREIHTFRVMGHELNAIAVQPDGRNSIVVGKEWAAVRRADMPSDTGPIDLLLGHTDRITGVDGSPDGITSVTVSADRTSRLWRSADAVAELRGYTPELRCVALSPDGQVAALGGADGAIYFWRLESNPQGRFFAPGIDRPRVRDGRIAPDGRALAVTQTPAPTNETAGASVVELRDLRTERVLARRLFRIGEVSRLLLSADCRFVAVVPDWSNVLIWDVGRQRVVRAEDPHFQYWDRCIAALSPDGSLLATGEQLGRQYAVTLRSGATGRVIRRLPCGKEKPMQLVFSADGSRIAADTGWPAGTLRVWSAADGKALRAVPMAWKGNPRYDAAGMAFSPDGRLLAAGVGSGEVGVLDVPNGRSIARWQASNEPVRTIAFSRAGGTLATDDQPGRIRLWKVGSWQSIGQLPVRHGVYDLDFSSDGGCLAATDGDRGCTLYDTARYPQKAYSPWHLPYVSALAAARGQHDLERASSGPPSPGR